MASSRPPVVVLGASGFVGSRVVDLWTERAALITPSHADLDVLDCDALAAFLQRTNADVVLNLAAGAQVDDAEAERGERDGRVYALNAAYPARLARLCGELNKYLVHVSTDYVFDGSLADRPYTEQDAPNPLSWYAETKLDGERGVLESGAAGCVARIEMPFSGREHPRTDLARTCMKRLQAGETVFGVVDQSITPIFLDDVVHALAALVASRWTGIIHLASTDATTPYRYVSSIAHRLGIDPDLVQPQAFEVFVATRPARRPQHSWLDVSLFGRTFGKQVLRPFEAELDAWVDQLARSVRT